VLLLMTYVVPQVANVFAGTKRALPLLTVVMLAFSAFLRSWGIVLLVALAGPSAAALFAAQSGLPRALRRRLAQPAAGGPAFAPVQRRPLSPARWPCWPAPACPS
jgi:general secretion pathway protein F